MSLSLRTTILATGCILAIGTSAARAQMPPLFYYSAPGNYATTQGTVNIPAAGYYYNMPLYAVPASVNPAPAQGFTYSSFYYPPNSSSLNASANRPAQGSTYSFPPPTIPLPRVSGTTTSGTQRKVRIGSSSGNDDAAEGQGSAEKRDVVGDLFAGSVKKMAAVEPRGSIAAKFVCHKPCPY